ncbi:MAG: ATP-binding protein DrrA1-3 family domain-containing protein, partial [Actinomycetota bacterium]
AADGWYDVIPGVQLADRSDGAVVLTLADDVDEQRILDLARAAGDVVHFSRVRPTLAELFREVVLA